MPEQDWAAPGSTSTPKPSPTSPAPADDGQFKAQRPVVIGLAVLIAICLIAGVVGLVSILGDDGDSDLASDRSSSVPTRPSAPSTAPTTGQDPSTPPPTQPTPSTTSPPVETISPEELQAIVDELSAFVEDARELEFVNPVDVELVGDEEFERRLLSDFDESLDDVELLELTYRALGIIEDDQSLVDLLKSFLGVGVLGFYDPETEELVVRGAQATPYVKSTIVHELVHALDDQHFELDRPEYEDRADEISTGFRAIVEGNARRIEAEWTQTLSDAEQESLEDEQRSVAEGIDLDQFPELIVSQLLAPYDLGERLVESILSRNQERGVDEALRSPPDTSEQILFAEKYFASEPRIEVEPPDVDGEVVDEGVVGALFWFLLFTTGDSSVNPSDAIRAVTGWGGDWYVTYLVEDVPCFASDFAADTAGDLDEFEQTLATWASSQGAASVERRGDVVHMETCASAAGVENPDV